MDDHLPLQEQHHSVRDENIPANVAVHSCECHWVVASGRYQAQMSETSD